MGLTPAAPQRAPPRHPRNEPGAGRPSMLSAVLHLASETDRNWVDRARRDVDVLLLDHAHCEKKAASTAVGLLFRYPEVPGLAVPLARLAKEELDHFELVLSVLQRRGTPYRRLRSGPYAARLLEGCRREEPGRLLDTLLCCALIEARSCERMALLADALEDGELRALYAGLLESEARHHATYVDLARGTGRFREEEIRSRLEALADHEARVLADVPAETRFHGR